MKKALLLCSSHNDLGLIKALRKLGYYIIVTGNRPNLPGQRWCDEFVEADYSNKELVLSIAKEKGIDCIVQCCNDFGVYTATWVAEQLGLPGYDTYENCLTLNNKDRFKEFCKKYDIISPVAEGFTDIDKAKEYVKTVKYPIILKPTDNSAGNGITRADDMESAMVALNNAFSKSRAGRIVIEPFITGTQHGFCSFLKDRKVVNVCSNNEYSIINPYRVEIDTYPASNYEVVKDVLIEQIEKIANILNLKDGIFHLQYIFDGEKPMIIEVMRRILGNMYHVPGNLLTGINWEYWETRVKCGLPIDDMPLYQKQEGYYAYKAVISNKNGVFKDVTIPADYHKYLLDQYYLRSEGYIIDNFQSDPLGFLFFMYPSEKIMIDSLITNYSCNIVNLK
jgi:biotin carboxylase